MNNPASVQLFRAHAREALERYTDPSGPFAWKTYDRLGGDPDVLAPDDCLAPALLDARVAGRTIIAMFSEGEGSEARLLAALQAVLDHPQSVITPFDEVVLDAASSPWAPVRAALNASNHVSGVKASKVTKILHRKRPALVPIFDRKVAGFYNCTPRKPWEFWPLVRQDVRQHGEWLDEVRSGFRTVDERPMSRLRALDIIIWMNVSR